MQNSPGVKNQNDANAIGTARPGTRTRAIFKFRMVACRWRRPQIYAEGTGFMLREIIKLGTTPGLDRESADVRLCALIKRNAFASSIKGSPYGRKRYHVCTLTTRGPSTPTTTTMTTRTATMTVEIDANGLRVRDEFRIMFLVYDRVRRHAS